MAIAPIISTQEISKGFHEHPLFSNLSLSIEEGERLALIGNNGSGKSTLLKILAGIEEVDAGAVSSRKGLRCAYVPQQETFDPNHSAGQVIEEGLLQNGIDHYEIAKRLSKTLGIAGFDDPGVLVSSLSGGWRKRLSIASALALEPDCLLLDEPTNHLDIDSIRWLESHLEQISCAVVFVSHDRYFIEQLATRVLEINRDYPKNHIVCEGGYSDFLEHREELLEQLQQQRRSLANKVRREVEWLRQGVKARTTKSRARINEAHRLINTLASSPTGEQRRAELEFSSTQRKSKELVKVEHLGQTMAGKQLFSDISLTISPGSRLAIVGPNGSGKTTFVRTLLGDLPPASGRVITAPNIRTVFMDQARSQLKEDVTLREFLCPHGDSIVYRDESIHVAAWGARFLFTHNHLSSSVSSLSGGERARALLAKSMSEECDILLFDEPTNDLDIATLETLEESFESFPGAIVLITHDRYLLDRAASQVLGIAAGQSIVCANYAQWEAFRSSNTAAKENSKDKLTPKQQSSQAPKKLSYKDARDLSMIEASIQEAEAKLETIQQQMDSGLYATDASKLSELCDALTSQQAEVDRLYERWQTLETLRQSVEKGG